MLTKWASQLVEKVIVIIFPFLLPSDETMLRKNCA